MKLATLRHNVATAKQCFASGAVVEEQVLAISRATGLPEAEIRKELLAQIQLVAVRFIGNWARSEFSRR